MTTASLHYPHPEAVVSRRALAGTPPRRRSATGGPVSATTVTFADSTAASRVGG